VTTCKEAISVHSLGEASMKGTKHWSDGMFRAVPLIILALLTGVACSNKPSTHNVSGDVFVTMASGDVKRGAGIEVVLAATSALSEADLSEVVAQRSGSFGMARSRYRENTDRNSANYTADKILYLIEVDNYAGEVGAVVRKHQVQGVRTDANGHFEIKDLKPGKYFLFTRQHMFDEPLVWMVPVDLTNASLKVDLSNHNEGLPAA
jgi:hypothetical protein